MAEGIRLAKDVEICPLDTSISGTPCLVSVKGRYFQVGTAAAAVLECLDTEPRTVDQLREALWEKYTLKYDQSELRAVLDRFVSYGLIKGTAETPPGRLAVSMKRTGRYLVLRLPLISERVLRPLSDFMAPAFSPRLMAILVPALALLQAWCWHSVIRYRLEMVGVLDHARWMWLLVANYACLLVHELGHTAGCRNRGIRSGGIGICIYLVFPAFYADVSEAWKLTRRDRLVVDAGGLYASLAGATTAIVMFFVTHELVWVITAALCDITVVLSLNPFIRMDGFWLLSDALGVQNLMEGNREVTKWIFSRLIGGQSPRPEILKLQPRYLRVCYLVYYPSFVLGSIAILWRIIGRYVPHSAVMLPRLARTVWAEVAVHGLSWQLLWVGGRFVVALVPLLVCLRYIGVAGIRVAQRLIEYCGRGRMRNVSRVVDDTSEA